MSIHSQKQHFTICLLRKKYSRFVNETKVFNFCASKRRNRRVFTTGAEICALVFMVKHVYNEDHDMILLIFVMYGF